MLGRAAAAGLTLGLVSLGVIVSCSGKTEHLPAIGEVVLEVDTDSPVPNAVNRVRIDIYGLDGTWLDSRDVVRVNTVDWPLSFALKRGSDLVGKAQWAEALAAFEESDRLRHHAVTVYNIGACQRAMGRYLQAKSTFAAALDEHKTKGKQLPDNLVADAKAYSDEIDRLLVKLDVTVAPADAALSVDGRPLQKAPPEAGANIFYADILPAGKGEVLPTDHVSVMMDPGVHVFTVSRKGFNDVVVNKTYAPGVAEPLKLELDKLPGTIRISANRDAATVMLANVDVGVAPVSLTRPGGTYDVRVVKEGFVPYKTSLKLNAGEEATMNADLQPESRPIFKEWWFWAGAAALITGITVTTYFLAKSDPAPTRPPLDRGGLGWVVTAP
jgi:hypothetical protein